ncbi:hypothetical protein R3P38DRAFT_1849816 [Favolaschia claudopus]|uniref:Fungal-type protein kinase domain-containing protein n=1 Tax=Favolaschia claudopus TaxID=2862362 RepID=A0AAW0D8S2_9AGAR
MQDWSSNSKSKPTFLTRRAGSKTLMRRARLSSSSPKALAACSWPTADAMRSFVAVFQRRMTRIFRFDRAGFSATEAFDWVNHAEVFPTFLYRLYNTRPGLMVGDDDTISIPSKSEKKAMYDRLCDHAFYNNSEEFSEENMTQDSLWIKAAVFRTKDGKRVAEVVRCFTFGPPLSNADGMFGRATRVYRVILEHDRTKPTVYALKDSWRQACRRPEVDFYDMIETHCTTAGVDMAAAGMAKCRGSLDLAQPTDDIEWDPLLHITLDPKKPGLERRHTRSLLTPVGKPLQTFTSTKALAQALRNAIIHLQIASQAGVIHRDVSEGNVLLQEISAEKGNFDGFLLDWDYAEFTEAGLARFHQAFPDREAATENYLKIEKSLKDFTGTYPFVAVQILEANDPRKPLLSMEHGTHHDLESFYWLLVWMTLRHVAHTHPSGDHACGDLFDTSTFSEKWTWLRDDSFNNTAPLFQLIEALRAHIFQQNMPVLPIKPPPPRYQITFETVSGHFRHALGVPRLAIGRQGARVHCSTHQL